MGHDVFISYSSNDSRIADEVCQSLESQGIKCWLAPRDIEGGDDWDEAILDGIDGCKILVLVFSSSANQSRHVKRELHRAVEKNKTLIPLRVEDIEPAKPLEYLMAGVQWLNALPPPPLKEHLQRLGKRVQLLTAGESVHARPSPAERVLRSAHGGPPPAAPVAQGEDGRAREGRSGPLDGTGHTPAAAPDATDAASSNAHTAASSGAQPFTSSGAHTATRPLQVALLYKRHAHPDEEVLSLLERDLRAQGHGVFIDRHLKIGVEWAKEIEKRLREADAVVPLLSAASVTSEMLAYEVQIARDAAHEQGGRPRLLPVRVNFEGELPEPLDAILSPIQYALWRGPEDDRALTAELLASLQSPPAGEVERRPQPKGAVPLDSKYYIERPTDEEFLSAVMRRDSIVLIKGARQMGKTSLLARGLQLARRAGSHVVITDLQKLNASTLESIEALFMTLGEMLADQLDLDVYPEDVWKTRRAPNVNFERYIRREVLEKIRGPLVWGLDEVDRLFTCSFASEVFGLFRTWHNERAVDPDAPWDRLTLAIAYATEAYLFITDPNQSPFNVGTRIELSDFTFKQVERLNELYLSPLRGEAEVARFYRLVSGHPYLVRRGLHEMAEHSMSISVFEGVADRDEGPFGDHLRRILVLLARDPALCDVVRGVLRGQPCTSSESFYRLRSAGIMSGNSARDARPRCQLYATYLERHLLSS